MPYFTPHSYYLPDEQLEELAALAADCGYELLEEALTRLLEGAPVQVHPAVQRDEYDEPIEQEPEPDAVDQDA